MDIEANAIVDVTAALIDSMSKRKWFQRRIRKTKLEEEGHVINWDILGHVPQMETRLHTCCGNDAIQFVNYSMITFILFMWLLLK